MSRWYNSQGEVVNSVDNAKGNGSVKPTLTHAKKLGLVPSVTSVLSLIKNEGLDKWKSEQLILACMTLPQKQGENTDDYVNRVIEDSQAYTEECANYGTDVHNIIENLLKKQKITCTNQNLQVNLTRFIKEHNIKGESEISVSNARVGGKLDFVGFFDKKKTLIDWKTQEVKTGKPVYHTSWSWQLAGYEYLTKRTNNWVNVVVCRLTDNIFYKVWDDKEKKKARKVFRLLLDLFYEIKGL